MQEETATNREVLTCEKETCKTLHNKHKKEKSMKGNGKMKNGNGKY